MLFRVEGCVLVNIKVPYSYRVGKAITGREVSRRMRLPEFKTIGM